MGYLLNQLAGEELAFPEELLEPVRLILARARSTAETKLINLSPLNFSSADEFRLAYIKYKSSLETIEDLTNLMKGIKQ